MNSDEDFFIGVIDDNSSGIKDEISVNLFVEDSDSIKVKLDTGAQVMLAEVYKSIKSKSKVLQPTKLRLTAY